MSDKHFYRLISRKLAGEASRAELEELDILLAANIENQRIYAALTAPNDVSADAGLKAQQAFALHQLKMHIHKPEPETGMQPLRSDSKTSPIYKLRVLISAAAMLIIACTVVFFMKNEIIAVSKTEIVALKGSKTNVSLPDGTKVWLNSDSKINYRNDFANGHRELWLSGEAFFDVKHDARHPFVIHTGKINIKVLGTAFNVKSYPGDNSIETSLIRGRIDVNLADRPEEHIIMHPNEKLIINKDQVPKTNSMDLTKVNEPKIRLENIRPFAQENVIAETAWLKDKIIFDNTPFYEIAGILERRFDIKVKFNNEKDKQSSFTGIFQDEDLNEILNLMQITKPFNYELNKKQLTIN